MPTNPVLPLVREWRKEYRDIAKPMLPYIERKIKQGFTPEQSVKKAFKKFKIKPKIQGLILNQMVAATAIGYGVQNIHKPGQLKTYYLNKVWPGDSLKLSKRIASRESEQIIGQYIRSEFKKQVSTTKLARRLSDTSIKDWRPNGKIRARLPKYLEKLTEKARFMAPDDKDLQAAIRKSRRQISRLAQNNAPNKSLKTAYTELVDKVEAGAEKALNKSVEIAVMEKGRYNAERIATTETARAYGISHDYRAYVDSDIIGVKYDLSGRHSISDVCDFHTNANFYGMGKGVYPIKQQPVYPFHPFCLCLKSDVFRDEAKIGEYDPKKGDQLIKHPPAGVTRKDLLGVQGSKDYKAGTKWQSVLKNWNGHSPPDFSGIDKSWF